MSGLEAICAKLHVTAPKSLFEEHQGGACADDEIVGVSSFPHPAGSGANQATAPKGVGVTFEGRRRSKRKPILPRCIVADPARTSPLLNPSTGSEENCVIPSTSTVAAACLPLDLSSKQIGFEQIAPSSSDSASPSVPPVSSLLDENGALDLTCSMTPAAMVHSKHQPQPHLVAEGKADLLHDLAQVCRPPSNATKEDQQVRLPPVSANPLQFPPLGLPTQTALFNSFLGLGAPQGAAAVFPSPFMFNYPNPLDQNGWMNALNSLKTQHVRPSLPSDLPTDVQTAHTEPQLEETQCAASSCTNPSPPGSLTDGKSSDDKGKMAFYNPKAFEDSGDYIQRYSSFDECCQSLCRQAGFRDHFHCLQCDKVLIRREEMIRHFKWHKKREESLQHGFMRYSPGDDCTVESCIHNGKQTHYHCLQANCDKVYISTSDVQMHANFHRKDAAIIQEGFQRFRATEDCGSPGCTFYRERTTHFHCRRPDCQFTFKNKADMEKHKSHHLRNDEFAKDGFKKYIKYEHCEFPNCKYSKMMNHIHCIRQGCEYVVHSSSQILSHKRKHERRNGTEMGSSHCSPSVSNLNNVSITSGLSKQSQKNHVATGHLGEIEDLQRQVAPSAPGGEALSEEESDIRHAEACVPDGHSAIDFSFELGNRTTGALSAQPCEFSDRDDETIDSLRIVTNDEDEERSSSAQNETETMDDIGVEEDTEFVLEGSDSSKVSSAVVKEKSGTESGNDRTAELRLTMIKSVEQKEKDEYWRSYLKRYTANDPCISHCPLLYKDHYHCIVSGCEEVYRTKERVREHARHHTWDEEITRFAFRSCKQPCREDLISAENRSVVGHHHCAWSRCDAIFLEDDAPFSKFTHYRKHDKSLSATINGRSLSLGRSAANTNAACPTSGQQKVVPKRRGRPPKYKKDVVVPRLDLDPEIWKDDPEVCDLVREMFVNAPNHVFCGFKMYPEGDTRCVDEQCMYYGEGEHFHCLLPRCHHATDNLTVVNLHRREFHHYLVIQEGFEFFDRNVNCRRPHCHNNKVSRHYHCVRPNCDYSFIRYNTMHQHSRKHSEMDKREQTGGDTAGTSGQEKGSSSSETPVKSESQPANTNNVPLSLLGGMPHLMPEGMAWLSQILQSRMMYPMDLTAALPPVSLPFMFSPPNITGIMPSASAVNTPQMIQQMLLAGAAPHANSTLSKPPDNMPLPESSAGVANHKHQIKKEASYDGIAEFFNSAGTCGRPFCKLRKKNHYHCEECHQAFSDGYRMKTHVLKHRFRESKVKVKKRVNKASETRDKITNDSSQYEQEEPSAKIRAVESTPENNVTPDISGVIGGNDHKLSDEEVEKDEGMEANSVAETTENHEENTVQLQTESNRENSASCLNTLYICDEERSTSVDDTAAVLPFHTADMESAASHSAPNALVLTTSHP